MKKLKKVRMALLNMPVSINCYYGDPTKQWGNTIQKLKKLEQDGHIGPVGVITKGAIGPKRAVELSVLKLPGLVMMISISDLPKGMEGVGHSHRYQSIKNLVDAGVKVFAAVRPLIPPYNTSREVVEGIFQKLQASGCRTACVSGFRGDEGLVNIVKPESDKIGEWSLRVKQMSGFDGILEIAQENNIKLFTRVACTVSHLLGKKGTYNPYWGSPQLVRCKEIDCPMIDTCGPVEPDEDILNWLKEIGYDVEYQPGNKVSCNFQADNRLNCQSCCTTCYMESSQPKVVVHNAETLGDLTFCRFVLGGTLCTKYGMNDQGEKDVGHVTVLQKKTKRNVHCINSWFVWADQLETCFGCNYCVSSLYPDKGPVGFSPVDLLKFLGGK